MQFEYDPERFIDEVKKRPGIWKLDDVEYHNKSNRYRLWNEVVTELMGSDVEVSKSELRELVLQLQKKWKSIRDCFQKYISNPGRTKRPYIYSKQLQFLLKNQELPQHEGGASSESDEGDRRKKRVGKWKTKRKLKIVNEVHQSSEDNDDDNNYDNEETGNYSNDDVDINIPMKVAKNNKPTVDEFAFANVDNIKTDTEDPDKLFLLSLLPHLKSVPEESRLNVKMELMHVLSNANFSASREHKFL